MKDETEPVVVYTTGHYSHAALMKSLLDSSGLMCVMLDAASNNTAGYGGYFAVEIRLVVPHTQAEQARAILAQAVAGLPAPDASAALVCPNCGHKFNLPSEEWTRCPDCGYEINFIGRDETVPEAKEAFPDALAYCPGCLLPSVSRAGSCTSCSGELKALAGGERLCPARLHVLPAKKEKATEIICPACKKIWIVE
ncbi:MAG: DUF2007 domain-containing protein [Elusimicrobia bacterium]|nr:DUF2007 domain-containing protein [Elusimicrobiota bacterium]